MSKALQFAVVALVVGMAQSVFAFDAISEMYHAFSNCRRADLLPLIAQARVVDEWGTSYEGYGCQTTVFAARLNGQHVYVSAYLCGENDAEHVSDISLRYTSSGKAPRVNDPKPFFTYYVRDGATACE